jgi:signal transduction histidine kinase
LTENWPPGGEAPEFIQIADDLSGELQRDSFNLAIADAACSQKRASLRQALAKAGNPAIVVHSDPDDASPVRGTVIELRRASQSWPLMTGLLGREILRRAQAEAMASDSHRLHAAASAEAMLGRYMIEMHSTVNNALTSVLGNAELLLLESGLPGSVMAQADTIRNMALRLHEVFQRFSSLEKELTVVARESGKSAMAGRS